MPYPEGSAMTDRPTLTDLQHSIWAHKLARGFNTTDVPTEFMLLMEEVGEAVRAYRRDGNLADELADIAIFVISLAQMNEIDLEEAIIAKMARNATRTYTQTANGLHIEQTRP